MQGMRSETNNDPYGEPDTPLPHPFSAAGALQEDTAKRCLSWFGDRIWSVAGPAGTLDVPGPLKVSTLLLATPADPGPLEALSWDGAVVRARFRNVPEPVTATALERQDEDLWWEWKATNPGSVPFAHRILAGDPLHAERNALDLWWALPIAGRQRFTFNEVMDATSARPALGDVELLAVAALAPTWEDSVPDMLTVAEAIVHTPGPAPVGP